MTLYDDSGDSNKSHVDIGNGDDGNSFDGGCY